MALRNHHTTTFAPTGTTAMSADTSAGCEPFVEVVYERRVDPTVRRRELVIWDDYFLRVLVANGIEVDALRERTERALEEGTFAGRSSRPRDRGRM